MLKGFVPIGDNSYINEDYIDKNRTHYDSRIDKVMLFDIYGNKYTIPKGCVKNKLKVNGLK